MVNFRNIANKAKDAVEKRGGSESLKRDAEELKGIAKGPGTLSEKAKRAASALKDPGADQKAAADATPGAGPEAPGTPKPSAPSATETPKQAAGKAKAGAAERTGTKATDAPKRPPEETGGAK